MFQDNFVNEIKVLNAASTDGLRGLYWLRLCLPSTYSRQSEEEQFQSSNNSALKRLKCCVAVWTPGRIP